MAILSVVSTFNDKGIRAAEKDLAKLKATATKSGNDTAAAMFTASQSMTALAGSTGKLGSSMTMGLTLPIGAAAWAATNMASDLSESINKVGVVFGKQGKAVTEWSKQAAEGFGMSQQAALEAAGTYGNLFVSLGIGGKQSQEMSTQLVELAGDLASFNNIDPTQALDALRAGLTGETEPLKKLGVNMNEATLKAEAMKLGLSDGKGVLDANAKAQAAYSLIMKQTGTAQGDFARTSDGMANSQKIAKAQIQDSAAAMGASLMPVMADGAKTVAEVAKSFSNLSPATQGMIVKVALAAAAMGPLLMAFSKIMTAGAAVTKGIGSISLAMDGAKAAPKWASTIVGATKATAAFAKSLITSGIELAKQGVKWTIDTARKIANTVATHAHTAAQVAANVASKAWAAAQWLLNAALSANPIGIVVVAIGALVAGLIYAWKNSEKFREIVTAAWEAIRTAAVSVFTAVKDFITGAWDAIKNTTTAVWDGIKAFFAEWGPTILRVIIGPIGNLVLLIAQNWDEIKAYTAAAFNGARDLAVNAFTGLKDGIADRVSAAIDFVTEIPGKIKSALGNMGTLLLDVGRDIVSGLRNGIMNAWHTVTSKLTELAGGLPAWAKKILGIRSPSTVFATIGSNVSEGMAQGIRDRSYAVMNATAELANGSIGKMAGIYEGARAVMNGTRDAEIALLQSKTAVKDAQERLNDVTKEFGPNSDEARLAALELAKAQDDSAQKGDAMAKAVKDGETKLGEFETKAAAVAGRRYGEESYSSGVDLVDGLINGMNSRAIALRDAATELVDAGITGNITKLLQIRSPSRVMAGVGANIAAGLAQGMNGAQRSVAQAAGGLAGAASDGYGATGRAGGTSGAVALTIAAGAIQINLPEGTSSETARAAGDGVVSALAKEFAGARVQMRMAGGTA